MEKNPQLLPLRISDGRNHETIQARLSWDEQKLYLAIEEKEVTIPIPMNDIFIHYSDESGLRWIHITPTCHIRFYHIQGKLSEDCEFWNLIPDSNKVPSNSDLKKIFLKKFSSICLRVKRINLLIDYVCNTKKSTVLKLASSRFGKILNSKDWQEMAKEILGRSKKIELDQIGGAGIPSFLQGIENEPGTREAYNEFIREEEEKVQKGNYTSHPDYPWLACIPDGITKNGEKIIEIKSHEGIEKIEDTGYVERVKCGDCPKLVVKDHTHEYVYQTQGNALICGAERAQLVICIADTGMVCCVDVECDQKAKEKILFQLREFYYCYFMPYLVRLPERVALKLAETIEISEYIELEVESSNLNKKAVLKPEYRAFFGRKRIYDFDVSTFVQAYIQAFELENPDKTIKVDQKLEIFFPGKKTVEENDIFELAGKVFEEN